MLTAIHQLNWAGIELIEIGSYLETGDAMGGPGNKSFDKQFDMPPLLDDLDDVDDNAKKTLLKRIARLVTHMNSEHTSELHGWDFEKDWLVLTCHGIVLLLPHPVS